MIVLANTGRGCVLQAWIRDYEVQLVRLSLGKPPSPKFTTGVHTGKMTAEKAGIVTDSWVRHLVKLNSDHNIVQLPSYQFSANAPEDHNALGDEAFTAIAIEHSVDDAKGDVDEDGGDEDDDDDSEDDVAMDD